MTAVNGSPPTHSSSTRASSSRRRASTVLPANAKNTRFRRPRATRISIRSSTSSAAHKRSCARGRFREARDRVACESDGSAAHSYRWISSSRALSPVYSLHSAAPSPSVKHFRASGAEKQVVSFDSCQICPISCPPISLKAWPAPHPVPSPAGLPNYWGLASRCRSPRTHAAGGCQAIRQRAADVNHLSTQPPSAGHST